MDNSAKYNIEDILLRHRKNLTTTTHANTKDITHELVVSTKTKPKHHNTRLNPHVIDVNHTQKPLNTYPQTHKPHIMRLFNNPPNLKENVDLNLFDRIAAVGL